MIQTFFLHNQLVCSQPAAREWVHAQPQWPFGKAFFCPACSEVWALSTVEGRETHVETLLCDKHPATPSRPVPGSLWLPWHESWNQSLPQELLEREFLLLTKEI